MSGDFSVSPLRPIDPITLDGQPVPPRKWFVENWAPHGHVTALYGDGGTGKSLLGQQLLTAAACGLDFLGLPTRHCKAIGVFCEDDEEELHRRQDDINKHYGIGFGDLENMQWFSRVADDNLLMTFGPDGRGETTLFYSQLLDYAKEFGAQAVVIDTLADTFGGNENARPAVRQFLSAGLGRIAKELDGSVIALGHPSQTGLVSGAGAGGSTAWSNSVRSRWYLTRPSVADGEEVDEDKRILSRKKANYSRVGDEISLRYEAGLFVPEQTDQPGETGLFGRLRRDQADRAFRDGLVFLNAINFRVNAQPNQANFAPRSMVEKVPGCADFAMLELKHAMNRAFRNGIVVVREDGPPTRRRSYLVLAEGR